MSLILQRTNTISSDGWKISSAVWHGFAVIANSFHIILIARMADLVVKPNGKVLLAMALSDICMRALNVVDDVTSFYELGVPPATSEIYTDALQEACNMSAVHIRYYITTFGCFERFVALCYPFKHKVNVAVRNIGKIMLLMALIMHPLNWSLCVIEYKVKEGKPLTNLISEVEDLAANSTNLPQLDSARAQPKGRGKEESFGGNDNETSTDLSSESNSTESGDEDVKNKAGLQKRMLSKLFFRYEVQLLPVVIVMMITMPLTVRELMRMRKASGNHSQDRGLVIAVIYILVITMISILCLIPLYILKNFKKYIP